MIEMICFWRFQDVSHISQNNVVARGGHFGPGLSSHQRRVRIWRRQASHDIQPPQTTLIQKSGKRGDMINFYFPSVLDNIGSLEMWNMQCAQERHISLGLAELVSGHEDAYHGAQIFYIGWHTVLHSRTKFSVYPKFRSILPLRFCCTSESIQDLH